jgi:hypothetical protein
MENLAFGRRLEPHKMFHQSALAAPASPHNDKHITLTDRKIEVSLQDKAAISHGQVPDGYLGLSFGHITS